MLRSPLPRWVEAAVANSEARVGRVEAAFAGVVARGDSRFDHVTSVADATGVASVTGGLSCLVAACPRLRCPA